jgi:CRP-like cAMP-binding protein
MMADIEHLVRPVEQRDDALGRALSVLLGGDRVDARVDPDEGIASFGVRRHRLSVPAGTAVFEEGCPSDHLYVVLDGALLPTAGLAAPDFWVGPGDLCGEAGFVAGAPRPLLGKPTPCVGREIELGMLEASFSTCARRRSRARWW